MPLKNPNPQIKQRFACRPGWMGLSAGVLVFLVTCLSGATLYLRSASALRGEVQTNLKSEAVTLSTLVDADAHAQFTSRAQEKGQEYKKALQPLYRVIHARPDIKFVYTCVMRNGKVFFVLDPTLEGDRDHDGLDDKSHIGQPYLDVSPEMLRAFQTGKPQVDVEPYRDAWGTFISGYAPLYDRKGRLVGVIGVDMGAGDYVRRLGVMQAAALVSLAIGLVVSLVVGMVMSRLFWSIRCATSELEARVHTEPKSWRKQIGVCSRKWVSANAPCVPCVRRKSILPTRPFMIL